MKPKSLGPMHALGEEIIEEASKLDTKLVEVLQTKWPKMIGITGDVDTDSKDMFVLGYAMTFIMAKAIVSYAATHGKPSIDKVNEIIASTLHLYQGMLLDSVNEAIEIVEEREQDLKTPKDPKNMN